MLERSVGGQYGIVRLNHGRGHLWRRIDREFQLALFPIVHAQPFHEQRREPGTSASAERVEHQETLQPGALVRQFPYPVQHDIHNLLADRVVATGVVVGRVLFAGDQLFGVKQLSVRAGTHFVCSNNIPLYVMIHYVTHNILNVTTRYYSGEMQCLKERDYGFL